MGSPNHRPHRPSSVGEQSGMVDRPVPFSMAWLANRSIVILTLEYQGDWESRPYD